MDKRRIERIESVQSVAYLRFLPAGAGAGGSGRIDAGFIPVFFDEAIFHPHDVEMVPLIFPIRIVRILSRAIPHHHRIGTVDERQRRSIYPLCLMSGDCDRVSGS